MYPFTEFGSSEHVLSYASILVRRGIGVSYHEEAEKLLSLTISQPIALTLFAFILLILHCLTAARFSVFELLPCAQDKRVEWGFGVHKQAQQRMINDCEQRLTQRPLFVFCCSNFETKNFDLNFGFKFFLTNLKPFGEF